MFERSSLSEQVELALKKEIISGRMQPGQRISVGDFKAAWKISSTPFRDAVRALTQQGFVTVAPRKGIYVAAMDAGAIAEVFDLRIALECMAVERATPLVPGEEAAHVLETYLRAKKACKAGQLQLDRKTDRLVHDLAWKHCGNRRLQKALESHLELIHWVQSTINLKQPAAYASALPEHIQIMTAICGGNAAVAARAMRTHLENSRGRLCACFASETSASKQPGLNSTSLSKRRKRV